ncbi:MAG: SpoIIE family protein phosphatase [Bacteroidia bacterium]
MTRTIAIIYFFIILLFTACQDDEHVSGLKDVKVDWSDSLLELVRDKKTINKMVDSLKQAFLDQKEDTSKIKTAIEISYRWLSPKSFLFANEAYDKSKQLNYDYGEAHALCYMGTAMHRSGYTDKAFEYFAESYNVAKNANVKSIQAQALSFEGNMLQGMENHSKSYKKFKKALEISREIKDDAKVTFCLFCLGDIYKQRNELETAASYYDSALVYAVKAKNNGYISYCYAQKSNLNQEKKQFDEALVNMHKSMDIAVKAGIDLRISNGLNNLGDIYKDIGQFDSSIIYYRKAFEFASTRNLKFHVISNMTSLAMLFISQNQRDSALKYIKLYEEHIKPYDNKGFEQKYYNMMASYNTMINNEREALGWLNKLNKAIIAKHKKEQKDAFGSMELELKQDQLEHDKGVKEVELVQQKRIKNLYSVGIVILAIMAGLIFRSLIQNKKAKKIIEEKNRETEQQKQILAEKNKEILDSIAYAKRIQSAILPSKRIVKEYLPDSFILYKPKDIVAGDFYWMEQVGELILFAAADCTGHGVPGAMVSVVCNNGLNRSVREFGLSIPGEILDKTREIIIEEFEKSEEEVKDGMDISLCALNLKEHTLKWAGANNPIWIFRREAKDNMNFIEIKPNKQPIGKFGIEKAFDTHEIRLEKGDCVYIFTDGYQDQFGGEKGKKFKASRLKELLLSVSSKPMNEQAIILDEEFEAWKGLLEQVDDVCLMGVRI